MATSTIILYKDSKIDKSKNFIVDSLEDYLATLSSKTFSKTQFIRHDLAIEIKLDLSQDYQEFLGTYNYNYCSIINSSSSKKVYYFIVDKKQLASSTIKLVLEMDTINTFKPTIDFNIDDKTLVLREHKDRIKRIDKGNLIPTKIFEKEITISEPYEVITYEGHSAVKFSYVVGMLSSQYEKEVEATQLGINTFTIYYEYDYTDSKFNIIVLGTLADLAYFDYNFILNEYMPGEVGYYRNIDFYNENINPMLYKQEENLILQEVNTSWNLVYKNASGAYDPSSSAEAIECYLLPDEPIYISYTSTPSATFTASTFNDSTYNIIDSNYNGEMLFKTTTNEFKVYTRKYYRNFLYILNVIPIEVIEKYVLIIYDNGNDLTLSYYKYTHDGIWGYSKKLLTQLTGITQVDIVNCPPEIKYYESTTLPNDYPPNEPNASKSYAPNSTGASISLMDLDRTDSKLIKIIKLPYSPTLYENDGSDNYNFGINWTYVLNYGLKLNNINAEFNYTFESEVNPFKLLEPLSDINFIANRTRNDYFESKIYNSEFYYNKFVYDSFGFIFRLECINLEEFLKTYSGNFKINFVMTSTINSKFAFMFPDYTLKYSVEDYDNVLTIARNNEVAIYNSQYLNYLRTGYNYDLKQLERNKNLAGLNVASSVLGSAMSAGIGIATGSVATAISSTVGATSSITTSIINSINSIKSQEESIERRLIQNQAQATSVSGSDDLDLMIAYSGNRAKIVNYELSSRMKNSILDLFYYCGYNENSQKIPDLNTRLYFNYLSCDLEFMEDTTKNIPEIAITRIKELYKGGVTFLHKVNGSWNFEQDKENFEVSLM